MWKVTDRRCGSFGEAIAKPLTITICKENEFTCDDGTCQDLGNRYKLVIVLFAQCVLID